LTKLAFYFQGGGVCLNTDASSANACQTKVQSESGGIFDLGGGSNPLHDHTIVLIGDCSGDFHIGNTSHASKDTSGNPVQQHGYWNAKAAIDWALSQVDDLDSLVISGCSTGAIAAQVWSSSILTDFEPKTLSKKARTVVISDSALPVNHFGWLLQHFEACSLPFLLADELREQCQSNQLAGDHLLTNTMRNFPGVVFSSIQSKADAAQVNLHSVLVQANQSLPIIGKAFAAELNIMFDALNELPNFVSYVVDGSGHCFLPSPALYTANTKGDAGSGAVSAFQTCKKDELTFCPVSGKACKGDSCCPAVEGLAGNSTFPCPSSEPLLQSCERRAKVLDCLQPPVALASWIGKDLLGSDKVASMCSGKLIFNSGALPYLDAGAEFCSAKQAGKIFLVSEASSASR